MRNKVVAFEHLGELEEERAELSRVLAIDPKLSIAGFRGSAASQAPGGLEVYVTGVGLAGLPEG
jgi:hypothetical protein